MCTSTTDCWQDTIFDVLPTFLRRVDSALIDMGQPRIPLDHSLFKFGSWMGGDRRGTGRRNGREEKGREGESGGDDACGERRVATALLALLCRLLPNMPVSAGYLA